MSALATQPIPHLPVALTPYSGASAISPLNLSVSPEHKLELLEYWRSITKRKWEILGLALAVSLLAGIITFAMSPVFRSTSTVLIEAGKVKVLSIEDVYTSSQQREHYQTQVEILKSREVSERTVRTLRLWDDPEFDPRKAGPSLRSRLLAMTGIAPLKTQWTQDELETSVINKVLDRLTIEPVRLSQLVKVSFEAGSPELAAKIANAVAAEYIDADRDSRFKLSQQVSTFLEDRLSGLRDNLLRSEKALQAYREQKGIVNIGGSAQAVAGRQVGDTSERLVQARSRRLELESAYLQAKTSPSVRYAEIPAVMRDPTVSDTLRLLNTARRNLLTLQESFGPQYQKVKDANQEVADLQAQLMQQSATVVAALRREYEAARSTETSLEQSLGAAQGGVQTVNREEFQLNVLEREAQSNRQLYEMFMSRAKETNLAGDVQAAVARIVDRAVPKPIAVRPAKLQIVAVAAVLTLFLGAIASLLMDRLDNTVKGGDDAEIRIRQPVLTVLPLIPGTDRPHMARMFVDQSHSHYSEGIRTARTGVLLSSLDVPHKILLITSTLPNEGKTTVAVNLALAHAQTKRTLLIDGDMRRSQAARALGIPHGVKGLTNLVAGTAVARECMYIVPGSDLMVMPMGDTPPNPLELLLSQRFKDALKQLSEEFEMVVIDSPPVELVSEALVLAPLATSVAFVIKAMSTPAPLVRKSLARIQRAGGTILGVIINQLDFKHAQRYYGEYGGTDYSYGGYGYNNAEETPKLEPQQAARPAALT